MRPFVVVAVWCLLALDVRADDAARVASAPEAPTAAQESPSKAPVDGERAQGALEGEPSSADASAPRGDARDDFDDLSPRRQDRVEATSGLVGTLFKTMFMLALVVGAAYLTLHKGVGKLLARAQQGQRIQVVERVPLGERRSLYLVRVDGKEMLLGVGEGGITALTAPAMTTGNEASRFAALVEREPTRPAIDEGEGSTDERGDARRQDG